MDSAPSPLPPCSVEPAYRVFLDRLDYLTPADAGRIQAAYRYAAVAHAEQKRMSGEPYITHPLAVSGAVVEWRMDADAICAALMHDVFEDTGTTKRELADRFGKEVAELVDGLVARIMKILKMPDGSTTAILQGRKRFVGGNFIENEKMLGNSKYS